MSARTDGKNTEVSSPLIAKSFLEASECNTLWCIALQRVDTGRLGKEAFSRYCDVCTTPFCIVLHRVNLITQRELAGLRASSLSMYGKVYAATATARNMPHTLCSSCTACYIYPTFLHCTMLHCINLSRESSLASYLYFYTCG